MAWLWSWTNTAKCEISDVYDKNSLRLHYAHEAVKLAVFLPYLCHSSSCQLFAQPRPLTPAARAASNFAMDRFVIPRRDRVRKQRVLSRRSGEIAESSTASSGLVFAQRGEIPSNNAVGQVRHELALQDPTIQHVLGCPCKRVPRWPSRPSQTAPAFAKSCPIDGEQVFPSIHSTEHQLPTIRPRRASRLMPAGGAVS